MAGKFLLGNSKTKGHRGYLANKNLPEALYLPSLIQIRLRQHPKIPFLKQVFCLNLLGSKGEGRGSKVLSESSF